MEKLVKARQNYQIMMETSAPPDKQTVKFMDKNTRIFGLMTHDAGKDISEKEAFEDVEIMEDAAGWHAIAKVLKQLSEALKEKQLIYAKFRLENLGHLQNNIEPRKVENTNPLRPNNSQGLALNA